jgi:hypothetical protein
MAETKAFVNPVVRPVFLIFIPTVAAPVVVEGIYELIAALEVAMIPEDISAIAQSIVLFCPPNTIGTKFESEAT